MALPNGFYRGPRRFNGVGPTTLPTQRWSIRTSGEIMCSPAIAPNGRIYIGSKDKKLYAIDTDSGSVAWSHDTQYPFYYNTPVVDADGNVYAPGWKTMSFAPDGTVRWSVKKGGISQSSAWLGTDNDLYITTTASLATDNPTLYRLDTATGEEVWSAPFPGMREIMSTPVEVAGGLICFAGTDGNVYAYDKSDGTLRVTFAIGHRMKCRPGVSADGSMVYVCMTDNPIDQNKIVALNTAFLPWSKAWEYSPGGMYLSQLTEPIYSETSRRVFAGWYKLLCVAGGTKIWETDAIGYGTRLVFDANENLFIGREDKKISAVGQNGQVYWTLDGGGLGTGVAIDDDGVIYFGGKQGVVVAYAAP
ncbi:MAG: PQQ-like beta-propeller repeat protein [Alphaproteobacteria bacterium]|nr:PQQ-like beta-propeller repeat protein [Alphaproteobacteria bacterium]